METFSSVGLCFKIYTLYIGGVRFSSCPSLGTSALITSREWHTGKGASGGSVVAMTTQRNLIGRTLLPPILCPHTFFPHTIPPIPKAPNCLNYHFKMQRKYRTVKWVLIARGVLETDAVFEGQGVRRGWRRDRVYAMLKARRVRPTNQTDKTLRRKLYFNCRARCVLELLAWMPAFFFYFTLVVCFVFVLCQLLEMLQLIVSFFQPFMFSLSVSTGTPPRLGLSAGWATLMR